MSMRVFVNNPDSGEPMAYCGAAGDANLLWQAIGHFIRAEVEQALSEGEKSTPVRFEFREMTDAELEALPPPG